MTNDEIERIPKAEYRKPDLIPAPRSTFGLWISFVICHLSFVIQPVHGPKARQTAERASHEPCLPDFTNP
jgi:hypothetical protein